MEDSHLIYHEFAPTTSQQWPVRESKERSQLCSAAALSEARRIHLFGIFDGHGGPKIANFAAKTLVSELENSPQFAEGNFEIAFKVAYCNIDRILRSQQWLMQEDPGSAEEDAQPSGPPKSQRYLLGGSQACVHCRCPQPAVPHEAFADANSDLDEDLSPKTSSVAYATTNESRSPPLVTPPTKNEQVDASDSHPPQLIDEAAVVHNQVQSTEAETGQQSTGPNIVTTNEESNDIAINQPKLKAAVASQASGITHGIRTAFSSIYRLGAGWWSNNPSSAKIDKDAAPSESEERFYSTPIFGSPTF
eukprot:Gregarina_sp_Poly_1__6441@NODE_3441_length_1096_cov_116_713314_g853_i1_p1_GENE_NODE_3441_length_1096_cov_116_713314_g853_i1NODE_3441_length_1096_cov_116_713314_g853_i1_p1_ORF_typecomplete_len343_score61_18PP2C/PF00481_21/5_4e10_NODE_3441_length_1096_cov_116_713314_g853_i11151029